MVVVDSLINVTSVELFRYMYDISITVHSRHSFE